MKKILSFLLFFVGSVSLFAGDVKSLLRQTQSPLRREVRQISDIPASLFPAQWPALRVSARLKGAVAEYKAERGKIYISRSILKQWEKRLALKYGPGRLPAVLAQCLAPVYVHELSHMRDQNQGKALGFVWPVTLEDEYAAAFWQLYVIDAYQRALPDYSLDCREWLPPAELIQTPAGRRRERIYGWYAQKSGIALPPVISGRTVASVRREGQVRFAGFVYRPKSRTVSLNVFLKRGGNWLYLSPRALERFVGSIQYRDYLLSVGRREQEIHTALQFY